MSFNNLDFKNTLRTSAFHKAIKENGIQVATGVPCGVIRHIIKNISNDKDILHIPAVNESEAVGIAAGAVLANKTALIYMQNSGLFASSNNIASLLMAYKIPVYIIVSYRGCKGENAPQHFVTGAATEKLIKSFGIDYNVYSNGDMREFVNHAFEVISSKKLPFISLLKRGWQHE